MTNLTKEVTRTAGNRPATKACKGPGKTALERFLGAPDNPPSPTQAEKKREERLLIRIEEKTPGLAAQLRFLGASDRVPEPTEAEKAELDRILAEIGKERPGLAGLLRFLGDNR